MINFFWILVIFYFIVRTYGTTISSDESMSNEETVSTNLSGIFKKTSEKSDDLSYTTHSASGMSFGTSDTEMEKKDIESISMKFFQFNDINEKFNIEDKITLTKSAEISKAIDINTGKEVAIKRIPKDTTTFEKFDHTVEIMKTLKHNNIISFIDAFQTNTDYYIVQEFAHSDDLRFLLEEYLPFDGKVPECILQKYFKNIIDAVEYMHSKNITHGDLKPENVLIRNLFKVNESITIINLEDTYEQNNTPQRDIWCIGAILYESLSGILPQKFDAGHLESLKKYQLSKEVIDLVTKMLSRQSRGITIDKIKRHPWYLMEERTFLHNITIKYNITEKIMAHKNYKVEKAINRDNNEEVLIKSIQKKSTNLQLISNEIKRMKKIQHDSIIPLQEVIETNDTYHIIQEMNAGMNLSEKLRDFDEGRLPESIMRKYFRTIIECVTYMHSENVIYGDLKTEHIIIEKTKLPDTIIISDIQGIPQDMSKEETEDYMIDVLSQTFNVNEMDVLVEADIETGVVKYIITEDTVKIVYFGCSHDLSDSSDYSVWWSKDYAAPELWQSHSPTTKSDVWSLGVLLYFSILGKYPYNVNKKLLENQKTREYTFKQKLDWPHEISKEAKELIELMLTVDPEDRITIKKIKHHPWYKFDAKDEKNEDIEKFKDYWHELTNILYEEETKNPDANPEKFKKVMGLARDEYVEKIKNTKGKDKRQNELNQLINDVQKKIHDLKSQSKQKKD